MWNYEKRLEFPVNIKRTDPAMAQLIITQYGGPDGELGASLRYLSQRFAMPYKNVCGVLTDVGTEELAHLEMICTIVHQLTRDLTPEQIKKSGFGAYYVDHTAGVWPQAASGMPFSATRTTYDNLLRVIDDPDVKEPLKFLRAREIVHFQRFGEALRNVQDHLDSKNFYAINPAFDCKKF